MDKTGVTVFTLVVLLPLLVALLLSFRSWRQASILSDMKKGIEDGQMVLDYRSFSRTFGPKRAMQMLSDWSAETNQLETDGQSRIAQIVRIEDRLNGDEYVVGLRSFELGSGNWAGPIGMRIVSLEFAKSDLLVDVCGKFAWQDGTETFIRRSKPVTLAIPWKAGQKPAHGTLSGKIRNWAITNGRVL